MIVLILVLHLLEVAFHKQWQLFQGLDDIVDLDWWQTSLHRLVPVQKKLTDRDIILLLLNCSTDHNTKDQIKIILQRQVVDDIWDAFHRKLAYVFVVVMEEECVHQCEKLSDSQHDFLVIGLHYYWKCVEKVLELRLVEMVQVNRLFGSILIDWLIRKFLESCFHPEVEALLFYISGNSLHQWPWVFTL